MRKKSADKMVTLTNEDITRVLIEISKTEAIERGVKRIASGADYSEIVLPVKIVLAFHGKACTKVNYQEIRKRFDSISKKIELLRKKISKKFGKRLTDGLIAECVKKEMPSYIKAKELLDEFEKTGKVTDL